MAAIFFLSAQPGVEELSDFEVFLRKVAHATEYALLTAGWCWALAPVLGRRALPAAVAIAFLYACSDEFHQTFVDGRNGSPVDVAIDSIGIAIAALLIDRFYRRS